MDANLPTLSLLIRQARSPLMTAKFVLFFVIQNNDGVSARKSDLTYIA